MAAATRTAPYQRRSGNSIETILDAAEQVFAEHGVAAATTAMIAAEAKISVGRVYYWFETKGQIARAVATRSEATVVELFSSLLVDDATLSTPELVAAIVERTVEVATLRPSVLVMLTTGGDGAVGVGLEQLRDVVQDGVEALISSRVPELDPLEAAVVATTLVSTVVAAISAASIRRDSDVGVADGLIIELVYLVSAYLACRFPATDDVRAVVAAARPARTDVQLPVQPLRPFVASSLPT